MNFRYRLPDRLSAQASLLSEFANGGTQCHARLRSGQVYGGLLLSVGTYIIAMRGHRDLPFTVDDIDMLFQADDDESPTQRGGWEFWDDWDTM